MDSPGNSRQRYLTVPLAAEYLGLIDSALRQRIVRGAAPPFIPESSRITFDRLALDGHMKAHRVTRVDLCDDPAAENVTEGGRYRSRIAVGQNKGTLRPRHGSVTPGLPRRARLEPT